MSIENEFFECLAVPPHNKYFSCAVGVTGDCDKAPCDTCKDSKEVLCYPEITDKVLLSLIVLLTEVTKMPLSIQLCLYTTEELKEEILRAYVHVFKNPILKDSKKEYLRLRVWKLLDLFKGDFDGE